MVAKRYVAAMKIAEVASKKEAIAAAAKQQAQARLQSSFAALMSGQRLSAAALRILQRRRELNDAFEDFLRVVVEHAFEEGSHVAETVTALREGFPNLHWAK